MNFTQVLIGRSSYTLLLLGEIEEHIGQNTASLQIAFVKHLRILPIKKFFTLSINLQKKIQQQFKTNFHKPK
jgi:hypothetical protein